MINKIVSFPYQVGHTVHCCLNLKKDRLPRPVISVGNMSFGGTGKTPVTMAIAKHLYRDGLKVAILTRGYKSKNQNFPRIVSSADHDLPGVEEIGDEPREMLEAFQQENMDIVLGIDPIRYRAGMSILQDHDVDVFILDDGMQHIHLQRDIEIVLKNINEAGFYREFPWAEKKADYLLHTKISDDWQKNNPDKHSVLFNLSLNKTLDYNKNIAIFTAIADNQSLIEMLTKYVVNDSNNSAILPIKLIDFPDHHFFNLTEVTQALSLGINLVTTQKDLVKIPEKLREFFHVAKLNLQFYPKGFLDELSNRVKNSLRGE
jgi:tetraacyldisaccharide 4'-kinase